jgi:hypothetical protein
VCSEESEYVHARDQLLGLALCGVFMGYAVKVLLGEPAHEEAHPFYAAPYSFSKRGMDVGAGWWPGRHCQFFESACFAQTYKVSRRDENDGCRRVVWDSLTV